MIDEELTPIGGTIFCIATRFRHFLKRLFIHTGGDRGRRSAERAPRDGGKAPHLALFLERLG
jgi:hypothetical protein